MKIKLNSLNSLLLLVCLNVSPTSIWAANPTLHFRPGINTIDCTSIASPIDIGYSPSSFNVLLSANFGSSGNPFVFYTTPNGGTGFTPFSTVHGITAEVPFAVASATISSFTVGEVFAASENLFLSPGYIMRLSPTGAQSPPPYGLQWAFVNDDVSEGGIYFDTALTNVYRVYVCSTSGNLFKISNNGTTLPIFSASLAGISAQFSALVTITNDATQYGAWAGKVLACDELGFLYIMDPNSTNSYAAVSLHWLNNNGSGSVTQILAEDMIIIPATKNLLWVDYTNKRLISFSQAQFTSIVGKLILITEFASSSVYYNGQSHTTHMWTIRYNSQLPGAIEVEPLLVVDDSTGLDFSSQMEHGFFVPH